jgi:hypothetical protein
MGNAIRGQLFLFGWAVQTGTRFFLALALRQLINCQHIPIVTLRVISVVPARLGPKTPTRARLEGAQVVLPRSCPIWSESLTWFQLVPSS